MQFLNFFPCEELELEGLQENENCFTCFSIKEDFKS